MLTLYYKTTCYYCNKVIGFAEANGITLDLKDIYSSEVLMKELIDIGGKRQVPFLIDSEKDVKMYESDDIIDYLNSNYVQKRSV